MARLYGRQPLTPEAAKLYLALRFGRIYPAYFVAVVVVAALSAVPALHFVQPMAGTRDLLRHILMIGSTGVFWSIPPEIQFYVFFLFIWLALSVWPQRRWLLFALTAVLAVDIAMGLPGPGILLPSKLPYFFFGVIAGIVFGLCGKVQFIVADLVAGALVVVLWGHTIFLGKFASFWGVHTALMAAVLVYLVATEPRLSAALLSSRVLTFLGRISFSLYLFHVPVMFLIGMLCASWSPDSAACSALVTTIAVAWMSFRVVEIPGRRLVLAAVAGADRIPAWHRQQRSAAP